MQTWYDNTVKNMLCSSVHKLCFDMNSTMIISTSFITTIVFSPFFFFFFFFFFYYDLYLLNAASTSCFLSAIPMDLSNLLFDMFHPTNMDVHLLIFPSNTGQFARNKPPLKQRKTAASFNKFRRTFVRITSSLPH